MRSRNIKPGLFKNDILGVEDPIISLTFIGLWCLADKSGILEDRPLKIRGELFPFRDITEKQMDGYLTVITRLGFIHRYEVNGQKLIQVVNFKKHQSPHHTEKESILPEYSDSCAITVNSPLLHGGNPPDSLIPDSLIPDSLIPDSLIPENVPCTKVHSSNSTPEFDKSAAQQLEVFDYWKEKTNHSRARFDRKRKQKVRDRLQDGYSVDDLKTAIDGCKASGYHQGENQQGAVYDDLELICRDSKHVDQFIKIAKEPKCELSLAGRKTMRAAEEWLKEEGLL